MYILRCDAFDGELGLTKPNRCCEGDCHVKNALIGVVPHTADSTLENKRLDWELGIQGLVCCGRYEYVRALSREWWVRKKGLIDGWSEEEVQKHLAKGSWHKTYEQKTAPRSQGAARRGSVRAATPPCPKCGGKWNGSICDNCGHVNL